MLSGRVVLAQTFLGFVDRQLTDVRADFELQ